MQEPTTTNNHKTIVPPQPINKKKNKLAYAKLYDDMISTSYTLDNGELNQEKIIQRSYSFTKN